MIKKVTSLGHFSFHLFLMVDPSPSFWKLFQLLKEILQSILVISKL